MTHLVYNNMFYAEGCRKHNFWTACTHPVKNYIFGNLMSRAIDWYIYELNRRGVGPGGSRVFWTPPPKITGSLLRRVQVYHRNPRLKPSRLAPFFEQIGLRGGVCGHVRKSEAHALGCRQRGE